MKKLIIILFLVPMLSFSQYFIPFGEDSIFIVDDWNSVYTSDVTRIVTVDTVMFIGGIIQYAKNYKELYGLGYWYNNEWHSLGVGLKPDFGDVHDFEQYMGRYYICGGFTGIVGVQNSAKFIGWDGTQWLDNPETVTGTVHSLTKYKDLLILGGEFYDPYYCVTGFDGTNFVNIGSLPGYGFELETYKGELYAGGQFYGIRKYNESTGNWDLFANTGDYVWNLIEDTINGFLYASAYQVEDIVTDLVAIWDGFEWTGIGENNQIDEVGLGYGEMTLYRGDIYVPNAESYTPYVEGNYVGKIAKWDGEQWSEAFQVKAPFVSYVEVYRDTLFVGLALGPNPALTGCMDSTEYGIARYFIPIDSTNRCKHIKPRVQSYTDTFYVNHTAQFYNNNAYADSWQWNFGDGGTSNIKDPSHIYTQTGTYTVSVTVTHGTCSVTATKDIVVELHSGINEIATTQNGFKIYPNPSKNELFLEINNSKLITQSCEIIDINGKVLKELKIKNLELKIEISDLEKGTYFVKIGNETQRFVKE